jgi:dTDP-4-dehydrorhamnose reductase
VKIVVTGAHGQLGSAIVAAYRSHADLVPLTRRELDLTDAAAIDRLILSHHPDVVINCAAFNDVDGAEDRAIDALQVNALAVKALARAATTAAALLVHYGTDFVFDGVQNERAYVEEDLAAPQSVYAASKLLGEWFALETPRQYVLRVESLFGGPQRRSTVDRIADAIRAGNPARVFVDRTVTPSYVHDVAAATWRLIESKAPFGVYHCVNSGTTSWFELAAEVARVLGVEADLRPVRVAEVTLKAKRPQHAALSNEKLRRAGIEMPTWQDALARYLRHR